MSAVVEVTACDECGRRRAARYAWQQPDCETCMTLYRSSVKTEAQAHADWVERFRRGLGTRQAQHIREVADRDGMHLPEVGA